MIRSMGFLESVNFLATAIAVVIFLFLGFFIYFNNKKSITSRSFLWFVLFEVSWNIVNYFSYQVYLNNYSFFNLDNSTLWAARAAIFLAVWQVFFIFNFIYVFPNEKIEFPKNYKLILIPWIIFVSILTFTPLVFTKIKTINSGGIEIINGPGIILFGATVIGLIISGIVILIKRTLKSDGLEKSQLKLILSGVSLTFILHIIFNFIFTAFLKDLRFIALGGVFGFPFLFLTIYAIFKHRLFNIKVIAAEFLTLAVWIILLIRVLGANNLMDMITDGYIFIVMVVFGIILIRSVLKEVTLSEQKSEFMSFAAHEIRTPLTAVKGYASLILEGDLGAINPQVKDAAQKIMISSNKVIVLITQYLNKSKMELSRLSYSFTVFDLGKLVKEVAQNFQVNAEQKGIILTADIAAGESYNVKADEGKIGEVIGNIIDNAIKYTDKGSVAVSVAKRNGKVTIKIADTGVGIPKETIPQLFKKFSRAETQKANFLGTGLGLFLAKTFIDAHKGRVWAESKGKGRGSQFYVELPAENSNIGLTRLAI